VALRCTEERGCCTVWCVNRRVAKRSSLASLLYVAEMVFCRLWLPRSLHQSMLRWLGGSKLSCQHDPQLLVACQWVLAVWSATAAALLFRTCPKKLLALQFCIAG
jgi:hypothetical protein